MKVSRYLLQFRLPAFLGNAEQSGQWRTPPFKAQLRQWWRVAYAASCDFRPSVSAMREAEGSIFGNAWLPDSYTKSRVRIRLEHWTEGALRAWDGPDRNVKHEEVPKPVGSQLYLGYGPLVSRSGTALKANAAIQAGERNKFFVAYSEEHSPLIEQALALMDRFGTVGGRSRNGWGSYSLTPIDGTQPLAPVLPLRPWRDALDLDWPHAIGSDQKGALIWQTRPFDDWKAVMQELAKLKIRLRTQFAFTSGQNAPRAEDRHWLSYPVTNHAVARWGRNARLPNTLRFKVQSAKDGKLIGMIFHAPCMPPAQFQPDLQSLTGVWQRVHAQLDSATDRLTRTAD